VSALRQAVAVALFAAEGDVGKAKEMFQAGLVLAGCEGNQARTLVARGGSIGRQRLQPRSFGRARS